MPSNRRTSNEYFQPEPARNMGSFGARNGLKKQQNSNIVTERLQLPQGDKRNLQNHVSQRTAKSSGDSQEPCVKRTSTDYEELVKHMSNVPGYLLRVEKQENIQEKALNVGVLDWGLLQKWEHNQKGSPSSGGNRSSSLSSKITAKSFSLPSTVPGDALANKKKQLELRKKELLDSETNNQISSSLSRKTTAKSFALPGTFPGDSLSNKSKQPKVRRKQLQDSVIDPGHSLSDESKQLKVRKKELKDSEINDPQHLPGELRNIILLLPRRSAQAGTLKEPPEFSEENLTKAKSPDDFTQKSEKPQSEIPHSCPLPSRVECDSNPVMRVQGLQLLSIASLSSFNSDNKGNKLSLSLSAEQNKVESENANNGALKILEQEMAAELTNSKSRNQSPHGRFSFSLSRMARSFSFKEGPAVQQFSSANVSVKSGPVKAEASGCLDDSNREKVKAQNRTRSSPLRRMLSTLLKPKSLNSLGFAEIPQPLKGSLNPNDSTPIIASESFKKEKHEPSTIQALMQLTFKDGLPFFRFVVNNSSNILAATLKISPSSGGDDMGQSYKFYSVNETKRKIGSWIIQGSKGKICGYAYDTIGQMTISSPRISDVKDSNNQCLIRESVLFGVECKDANQLSQKFTRNIELAAVVVKMPREELIHGVQQSCKDANKRGFTESLPKDGSCFNFVENEGTNSKIVILPGGIHSLPNKGAPSSLIHRWRYGGSCDCGGWDVGCKLRILSNQNGSCKNQMTCQACLSPDHVELFVQGETQRSRPIFILAPQKHGLHRIEFDSSVSALQAFFIAVTVTCCQKSSNLSEASSLSKENVFEESVLRRSDGMENKPTILLGKMPAKYAHAPNPPLSPVGRV